MVKYIRVELPYAVFAIEVGGGIVRDTAPIAKWMIGKDTKMIKQWIASKGGSYMVLDI